MGIPVKQLVAIPDEVSGRKITNRGVHILPQAYHGEWLKKLDYWIALLHDMGISFDNHIISQLNTANLGDTSNIVST